jgi:hypothetical protein
VIVVICTYRVTNSNNSNQLSLRRGDQRSGAKLSLKRGNLIDPTGSHHSYIKLCVAVPWFPWRRGGFWVMSIGPLNSRGWQCPSQPVVQTGCRGTLLKLQGQGQGQNLSGPYGHESGSRAGLLILIVVFIAWGGLRGPPPRAHNIGMPEVELHQNMHRRGQNLRGPYNLSQAPIPK